MAKSQNEVNFLTEILPSRKKKILFNAETDCAQKQVTKPYQITGNVQFKTCTLSLYIFSSW